MKVSVILPTYNEAGNIVELVNRIIQNIPPGWQYEILVVDDNSPDQTYQLAKDTFKSDPAVVPVLRTTDRGFAKSIRAGIERATGDQILVMDTDFTHDPVEIPRILHVSRVYDIVSGSRFCPGGSMQDTPHYVASLAYNWVARILLRTQIQDNLGGYFTISKKQIERLPFDNIFFGYGEYFFRLLHYAQKRGMTVVEIPAQYHARTKGASKSRFLKMLFTYTIAMIKLRLKSRKERLTDEPNKNSSNVNQTASC
jgi:dolichol-phosphate mannosyltransferase